jgi:hypothetical protein
MSVKHEHARSIDLKELVSTFAKLKTQGKIPNFDMYFFYVKCRTMTVAYIQYHVILIYHEN